MISFAIGRILLTEAALLLLPAVTALLYRESPGPFLVTALVLLPLRLDPVMYTTLVILAATPTAGYTSIFAQQYRRDAGTAAQLVTLTTLCCILTLPCFAVLAGMWSGA